MKTTTYFSVRVRAPFPGWTARCLYFLAAATLCSFSQASARCFAARENNVQQKTVSLSGLIVESVAPDSLAAQAGIKAGDRLIEYAGRPLPSPAALRVSQDQADLIDGKREVTIDLERGGERHVLRVGTGKLGLTVRPILPEQALELYLQAKLQLQDQRTADAIPLLEAAARSASEAGDKSSAAWLWDELGFVHEGTRKWGEAYEAYLNAWKLLENLSDTAAASEALKMLGHCSHRQNNFVQAARWYEQALKTDMAAAYDKGSAKCFGWLADVAYDRGDLKSASGYWLEALKIHQKVSPNTLSEASCLYGLGLISRRQGNLPLAQDYFQRLLPIIERLAPNSDQLAGCLANLGVVALDQGELQLAHDYLYRSLEIFERLAPDSLRVANSNIHLGNIALIRGHHAAARENYHRALAISERLSPGSLLTAACLGSLGELARLQGDLVLATDYIHRALRIFEQLAPGSLDVANCLNNLGAVASAQGLVDRARDYHQRALEIRERQAPDSWAVAMSLANLGLVAHQLGDFESAEKHYARALAINERLVPNSLEVAKCLGNLGAVASSRGDSTSAWDYHQRALAIYERIAPNSVYMANALDALGNVAVARGDLILAEEFYGRAVTTIETLRSRITGHEARRLFLSDLGKIYANRLRNHVQRGETGAAFEMLERLRARVLLDLIAEREIDLRLDAPAELLQRQQQLDDDARRLYAALAKLNAEKNAATADELRLELLRLREAQVTLTAELQRVSPRFAAIQYPQPLDLAGAYEALAPGTVLLAYFVTDRQTYLFTLAKERNPVAADERNGTERCGCTSAGDPSPSLQHFEIQVTRSDLHKSVQAFRQAIERRQSFGEAATHPGKELYDLLVRPAQKLIEHSERVLICPDGPLHSLPFGSLVAEAGQGTPAPASRSEAAARQGPPAPPSPPNAQQTDHGVRYFAHLRPLHTIVSMTVYAELRRSDRSRHSPNSTPLVVRSEVREAGRAAILAFGDPDYGTAALVAGPLRGLELVKVKEKNQAPEKSAATTTGQTVPAPLMSLPATRREVETIARIFGNQTHIRLGKEATEHAAKQESPRAEIIHFACHGLLDNRDPLASGLALSSAEGDNEDGILRAWEIFEKVRLDADLVVLSACQSGLGETTDHEGVIGLTRAMQYAGARSIVVSMWNVADDSTAELMKAFYTELRNGSPKDVALQRAQAVVRANPKWQHPFYWAPFILVGDWRPLPDAVFGAR